MLFVIIDHKIRMAAAFYTVDVEMLRSCPCTFKLNKLYNYSSISALQDKAMHEDTTTGLLVDFVFITLRICKYVLNL